MFKQIYSRFFKFGFVGLLNTLVGYGCFYIFLLLHFNYLLALTLSHIIGVTHSFFWNKFWTFKSKTKNISELLKFITVYTLVYIINFLLLFILVQKLKWNPKIAQLLILFIITIISFVFHNFWTFYSSQREE